MEQKNDKTQRQQKLKALEKKHRIKNNHIKEVSFYNENIFHWQNKQTVVEINKDNIKIFDKENKEQLTIKNEDKNLAIWDNIIYHNQEIFLLKRKNQISRMRWDWVSFKWFHQHVLAANIDIAVIVAPAKQPDFQPNFIDRFIVVCQIWWVKPLICITKSDLADINHPILLQYQKIWIEIIKTSIYENKWIDELKNVLSNKTCVFLWKSWAGKSSLTNILLSQEIVKTQGISQKSDRWKHTTTISRLYERKESSYIIDTPWIKSLGIEVMDKKTIKDFFPEFIEFAPKCRYKDCLHQDEPLEQCWIKQAVQKWNIDLSRYQSYLRLLDECI